MFLVYGIEKILRFHRKSISSLTSFLMSAREMSWIYGTRHKEERG